MPTVSPPLSAAALIQKHFNFLRRLFEGGASLRMEINCPTLFTGIIVQNVAKIIILSFFPAIASKYFYQLSEKILFLSVFGFLSLRHRCLITIAG